MKRLIFIALISLSTGANVLAQSLTNISINTIKPVAPIQSTMWGVFFEDINFAADGGIYAELVEVETHLTPRPGD